MDQSSRLPESDFLFSCYSNPKLSDRTKAGLARAKKDGRVGGRPPLKVAPKDKTTIKRLSHDGVSQRKIVEEINRGRKKTEKLSRTAVQRVLAGEL